MCRKICWRICCTFRRALGARASLKRGKRARGDQSRSKGEPMPVRSSGAVCYRMERISWTMAVLLDGPDCCRTGRIAAHFEHRD